MLIGHAGLTPSHNTRRVAHGRLHGLIIPLFEEASSFTTALTLPSVGAEPLSLTPTKMSPSSTPLSRKRGTYGLVIYYNYSRILFVNSPTPVPFSLHLIARRLFAK